MSTMGGNAMFVDQTNSPLGERESIADVARNVERWVDLIVLRTYAHRHHHGNGSECARTRNQCTLAIRASLPGACGLHDIAGTLRLSDWSELYLRRRRQQCVPFSDAHRRSAWRECYRGDSARLFAGHRDRDHWRAIADANHCELRLLQDPQAAVEGADAVYTDVCVSMGFEHESTKRAPIFRPFQVNEALMQKASPNAVFMHCLPAAATRK